MIIVDLVARWLHILPAITLVGGTFFMRFAYAPALSGVGEEQRDELQAAVRRRWAKLVALSALLLLLSGFYNTAMFSKNYEMQGPFGGMYHALIAVKLVGALAVFWIASLLSGRSEAADKLRQKESLWLNVNVLLMLLLVLIAGVMKMTERQPKEEKQQDEARHAAPFEPPMRG